jgi:CRISPR-associated protein Csb2
MTLVLEIEYLSGVSFAAIGPDSDQPDWPPQPDRIFSALTATWAARGRDSRHASALEWLEQLPPPRILASRAEPRSSVAVFVPPNDPRSEKQKHARGVLPALRSRQPRRFPAVRPEKRVVRVLWAETDITEVTLSALDDLARDTSYIGHSTSLARCRFLLDTSTTSEQDSVLAARRIYPGRFAELCRAFESGRRPLPGAPVRLLPAVEKKHAGRSIFSECWLLLEHVDGDMPDLRACALVGKALRDALLSGYRRIGLEDEIPEVISGHEADRTPSRKPHLAIVPLPFAGFPYADGHVLGFALVPPRESTILGDETFRRALRTLAPMDERRGRRCLTLGLHGNTRVGAPFSVVLSPTDEAGRRSLNPALYSMAACSFGTVTPIALDRHLKESGNTRLGEIAAHVTAACRNIGLPEPVEVVADKHSSFEGVPSAYPSGKSPKWMRWRLTASLASRQLTHAVIRFATPVTGPVVLGAGRYIGLGLCRPLDSTDQ